MKIQKLAAMLLTIGLSLAASQYALAEKPTDGGPPPPSTPSCDMTESSHDAHCGLALLTVFDAIADGTSVNARDESKLQSKVCSADDKLEVSPFPKTGDAIQKLQDIIDTVNSKRKISDKDAKYISDQAVLAQICVGSL